MAAPYGFNLVIRSEVVDPRKHWDAPCGVDPRIGSDRAIS